MKIIDSSEFAAYWKAQSGAEEDQHTIEIVRAVIDEVQTDGDEALWRFSKKFEKAVPERFEVPQEILDSAHTRLQRENPALFNALSFAAKNIHAFAQKQRAQFADFECEISPGLFTGQRVIPVQRAAIYAPGGAYPLISSVLMGLIPAFVAGVDEAILLSPPSASGWPDERILAAATIACKAEYGTSPALRVFALGGAQAVAAAAFGTETVPRCDMLAGPGNRFVTAAKRLLFGQFGIDLAAGPSEVLVIAAGSGAGGDAGHAGVIAADMLAQAEHDKDARARLLVPDRETAEAVAAALRRRLAALPTDSVSRRNAEASLEAGGLAVIYRDRAEAVRIANAIAPEHLEVAGSLADGEEGRAFISSLRNYGSLFIGERAGEVLGDYAAGLNHTLPTDMGARYTSGLGVRNFLKTATTLRCTEGSGYHETVRAAELLAEAEGLKLHAAAARERL
jgi:histidinol dehydrogenase